MDSQKVTVNLPKQTVEDLREMADDRGVTRTETLRDAVAIQKFIRDELKRKSVFLVHRVDGETRELIFS